MAVAGKVVAALVMAVHGGGCFVAVATAAGGDGPRLFEDTARKRQIAIVCITVVVNYTKSVVRASNCRWQICS